MLSFGSPSPSRTKSDASSSLIPQSSSPISSAQARRSGQYKSRARPTRHSTVSSTTASPAQSALAAENALVRERLLAKYLERRERDRARSRASYWAGSSDHEASSDHDVPMDVGYDDNDEDDDNEILIGRIMAKEHRRTQQRLNRSFEFEVGSSPGIAEELVEEFFNNEVPPADDAEYAALYDDYMAALRAEEAEVQDPIHTQELNMRDDFPMTPEHQIRRRAHRVPPPPSQNVLSECPSCSRPWILSDAAQDSVTCVHCSLTLSQDAVSTAWNDEHRHITDAAHRPVIMTLPDGQILSCAAKSCDWCYGL